MNLVGFRTLIVGLFMAIGVPALTYLAQIDWTALGMSPVASSVITSVIFILLRLRTSTPVFKQNAVSAVAAMPDEALRQAGVAKMLVENTLVGKRLADETPGEVVQVVGQATAGYGRRA